MEHQKIVYKHVIMSRLTRLQQVADEISDSSPEEVKKTLPEENWTIREEVNIVRLINTETQTHDANRNPAYQTFLPGTKIPGRNSALSTGDPTLSPGMSTVDRDNEPRSQIIHPERSLS